MGRPSWPGRARPACDRRPRRRCPPYDGRATPGPATLRRAGGQGRWPSGSGPRPGRRPPAAWAIKPSRKNARAFAPPSLINALDQGRRLIITAQVGQARGAIEDRGGRLGRGRFRRFLRSNPLFSGSLPLGEGRGGGRRTALDVRRRRFPRPMVMRPPTPTLPQGGGSQRRPPTLTRRGTGSNFRRAGIGFFARTSPFRYAKLPLSPVGSKGEPSGRSIRSA